MLNTDFYAGAIIRLATLQKQKRQAGRLLFATVSLLPRGRSLPPPMEDIDRCPVGKTGETVFFRRVLLSVQEAVDWYRALGSGDDKSPNPSANEERNSKYDGIKIEISTLTDDPAWPYLGLPIGEGLFAHFSGRSHPAPFIGNAPARIHRRFGSQDGFDSMLADDKAVAFVARRLHVDLRLYREYLGSVALVAPDPVLKQIDHFMIPASADRGERIFYRFVPRAGESLAGLKLSTFDEQTYLLTDFNTQDIPADGILDIDKGDCTGAYGYVVTHPRHGVLTYSPPYPFLRQVGFSIHPVSSGGRTVSVPTGESGNSPRMEYQAAQRSPLTTQSLIGDAARIPNVNARIAIAASRREKLANAKQYGQRWFPDGSRKEAMLFIQGELKRAKSRVMIADPYLAGLQLGQFLYAVNPETTSVTLLTSGLAFKAIKQNSSKAGFGKYKKEKPRFRSKKQEPSKMDVFNKLLAQLERDAKVTAKAYVLQSSILHDRFLVIDDVVWFLGNSLNTLGEKASLIVKLPNPDEVIGQLVGMLKQAISFDNYKKRQAKNQEDAAS
ncbi:MAG: VPA1262 family N-terminal domain-containing protein [Sulfuriferula sp.]|nr:VPA1262 family N-terminal domain-containing protein [Sulfuriferula sp.]